MTVRRLERADVALSSSLHAEVLPMEFLARAGPAFLAAYHRAWLDAGGLALAAVADGDLLGVLLGTLDPAEHFRRMARRRGAGLAARLVWRAASRPGFALELLVTRGARYARGLVRIVLSRQERPGAGGAPARPAGEVTHVMVAPRAQGTGVGRALMEEAARAGREAGLRELVLVTPPELAAGSFYEHIGWRRSGVLTSRSGEHFVRYRLELR